MKETPTKRILMRYDRMTDEVVFCEEYFEEPHLEAARHQREKPTLISPDFKPLAVIPESVQATALRDGWFNDKDAWRKWANNADYSRLRTSDGKA